MTLHGEPLAHLTESLAQRDRSSCWLWPYSLTDGGYGEVRIDKRMRKVTHVVLEREGHPRPSPAFMALHSCDTPACFNPECLRWGTAKENVADMVQRGRQIVGGRHRNAKLVEADVIAICRQVAAGEARKSVARQFGVSKDTVGLIVRGLIWRHVTDRVLTTVEPKTHCNAGHELTTENVARYQSNGRPRWECRACKRERRLHSSRRAA